MLHVGDFEDHVHAGLTILAARFDVADVGVGIANHGSDLFQHAKAIVAKEGDFYWIGNRLAIFVTGPQHVDASVRFVKKIGDIGTIDGMDGHSFTSSDVAHDRLASNRVTTARTIYE